MTQRLLPSRPFPRRSACTNRHGLLLGFQRHAHRALLARLLLILLSTPAVVCAQQSATLPDAAQQSATLPDAAQQPATLPDAAQQSATLHMHADLPAAPEAHRSMRLSPGNPTERPAQRPFRRTGMLTLHAAVGSTNGARIGALYFVHDNLAPEVSLGYVRVVSRYVTPERTWEESASGLAATGALNWYPFHASDISPFFSFAVVYMSGLGEVGGLRQYRYSGFATLGTEFYVTGWIGGFFRLGPSISTVYNSKDDGVKTGIQLDAGLILSL